MPPGVEPPARRRWCPPQSSILLHAACPPPPQVLGSSVVPDRGLSPAASSSDGLELRRARERAGSEQRAAAAARCDLEDATTVVDSTDAGEPPRACRWPSAMATQEVSSSSARIPASTALPVLPLPSRRARRIARGLSPLFQTVSLLQVPIDAESLLVGVSIEGCLLQSGSNYKLLHSKFLIRVISWRQCEFARSSTGSGRLMSSCSSFCISWTGSSNISIEV
ncbi:unnamed protein product [Urochloa humidicola]